MRASVKVEQSNGEDEFYINIHLFQGLVKEVRQRMAIERARAINLSVD